uniref:Phosphogluconate dehydrogenase NAD-binding putative C-terminal domain-containing protein n=1 Tax=Batrachochytrium dendrobatidis (strain JAM81 / FGSC 10211) TaxID=684364 RepID=F4PG38_BATDJ|eukprot:XP_006683571.1 hypothetical protein BATDEDRAFT_29059 [Batrachochytrium dendrobatidis JAM81]
MSSPIIGFIGLGEAAFHICSGLKGEGIDVIYSYDVQSEHPVAGPIIHQRSKEAGVILVGSLEELLKKSTTIFCATSAKYAVSIAKEVAEEINPEQIYIDLNSASPSVKKEVGSIINSKGGKFVDGAIMEPVPPHKHRVPILASGDGAKQLEQQLNEYGMRITFLNQDAGSSSAMKMCRSIFMKGFTALLLETLRASYKFGIDKEILKSIERTLTNQPFEELINLLITRTAIHAERRVTEMDEVINTLQDIQTSSRMSQQTKATLQEIINNDLKGFFSNTVPNSYTDVLEGLETIVIKNRGKKDDNGDGENEGTKNESTYPDKPVTFVAPSGAGGAFDTALRSFTKQLADTKIVEQQMTVEVKPGGGGSVFLAEYATQDVDNDYKLFLTSPTMLINHLKKDGNSPYGYQDTTPIATLFQDYGVIAVSADSQFSDLKSLFDYMKESPSEIAVAGGSAPGAVDHLSFLIPATDYGLDGVQVKYVPYDGKGESMTALLGGNADVLTSVASSVGEYLEAGNIKVLAVDAPERLPGVFADVPTMKELGINSDFAIWRGIFGPKNMSEDAKAYWEEKIAELVETDEWQAELTAKGWEHFHNDSAAFIEILQKQEKSIKKVLEQLGMTN